MSTACHCKVASTTCLFVKVLVSWASPSSAPNSPSGRHELHTCVHVFQAGVGDLQVDVYGIKA